MATRKVTPRKPGRPRVQTFDSVRAILRTVGPENVKRCIDRANMTADTLAADIRDHNDPDSPKLLSVNELTKAGNYFLALMDALTPRDDGEIYLADIRIASPSIKDNDG